MFVFHRNYCFNISGLDFSTHKFINISSSINEGTTIRSKAVSLDIDMLTH